MPEATPCCGLLDAELCAAAWKAWIIIEIGCSVTCAHEVRTFEIFSDRPIALMTLLRHSSIIGAIGLAAGHIFNATMAPAEPTLYSRNAF